MKIESLHLQLQWNSDVCESRQQATAATLENGFGSIIFFIVGRDRRVK